MTIPIFQQRILMAALLLFVAMLAWPGMAWAAVPNADAVPAYAEEQTILQTQKDVPEPGWSSAASGKVHMDRHFLGQYGSSEGNVIVQRGGNTWRTLRNGPIALISGVLLLVVPLLIAAFYLRVGPAHMEQPPSGRTVTRFTPWERLVHWATAISFIVLAVTGLIVLFGKKMLLPWMGHDVFATIAIIAKYLHNFGGPLFILCSIVMFFTFLQRNFFRHWDWAWLKRGGGLATHEHIPAGFFNAGEKVWFWGGVALLGLVTSLTGLILDFVTFGQTRYVLQWANYLHLGSATLYMLGAMGHSFIGTLGTPGAYDAMRHGSVDLEWARSHHRYWYDEIQGGADEVGGGTETRSPGPLPQPRH